jgi:type VI secretion system protein ImpB
VVQQIEPLKELLDIRTKLADLRNKLAGNDRLEDLLGEVLSSTEKLQQLTSEAGKNGKGGSHE